MKSDSEEFCKDEFDKYLKNLCSNSLIVWEEVSQKDEPPDYYLFMNGSKHAVEVTMLMEKVNLGTKKPLPVRKVRDLLRNFVADEVESIARDAHYLHGAYLVYYSKPIDNFTNVKKIIQNELLAYISETQGLNSAANKIVYKYGRQKCEITKIHDREDKVVVGGPIISKWEETILAEASQLLFKSIAEKESKLRNISCPKILLLHDKYYFADFSVYKTCMLSIASLVSFHTLFIVEKKGKGLVLHSQDPRFRSEQ